MPDERWPGVIQHPLNHASGNVLSCAVSFEHRALTIVGSRLRLAFVVFERGGRAVSLVQTVGKDIYRGEPLSSSVIVPDLINRPQMILGNKAFDALEHRNRRAGTGFCVVAICAARL